MKTEEIKSLLRETVMRCNLAFPEDEQDLKWFDEGLDIHKSGDFQNRLFKTLGLGTSSKNVGRHIKNVKAHKF